MSHLSIGHLARAIVTFNGIKHPQQLQIFNCASKCSQDLQIPNRFCAISMLTNITFYCREKYTVCQIDQTPYLFFFLAATGLLTFTDVSSLLPFPVDLLGLIPMARSAPFLIAASAGE